MTKHLRPPPRVFRLSTVAEGSQLIVGADIDGIAHDLVTVVADEDETLWVRLEAGGRLVEIPLETLATVVKIARDEVHPERWWAERAPREPGAADEDEPTPSSS